MNNNEIKNRYTGGRSARAFVSPSPCVGAESHHADITVDFREAAADFERKRRSGPQPIFRPLKVAGPTGPEIAKFNLEGLLSHGEGEAARTIFLSLETGSAVPESPIVLEIAKGASSKQIFIPWPRCGVCNKPVNSFTPEHIVGKGVRWEARCHGEKEELFISDKEIWTASRIEPMTVFKRADCDRVDSSCILTALECIVENRVAEAALLNARMYLNGMKPCVRSGVWESLESAAQSDVLG